MPNYIYHMVKKNDSKTIRYTIGMTISEHSDPINDHFDPEKVLCLHKQNEKTYVTLNVNYSKEITDITYPYIESYKKD